MARKFGKGHGEIPLPPATSPQHNTKHRSRLKTRRGGHNVTLLDEGVMGSALSILAQ